MTSLEDKILYAQINEHIFNFIKMFTRKAFFFLSILKAIVTNKGLRLVSMIKNIVHLCC